MAASSTAELYDPYFHTTQENRYEVYARLREEHPLFCSLGWQHLIATIEPAG